MTLLFAFPLSAWRAVESTVSENPSTDWVSYLLNGGPFAVVLLLILLDKLGTHAERDRLRAENARLQSENQALNVTVRTEVVAPLSEQNRLMQEIVMILDDVDRFPRRPPTRRKSQ